MKSTKSIVAVVAPLAILGLAAGVPIAAWLSGCGAMEKALDAVGDATAGTAVGDLAKGGARLAESGKDYSTSQEHYIGRAVAVEILSRYKVHPDPALTEYVNLVGQAVLAANPEALVTFTGYHFTVLEGDEVNAVSAPGGFVFLTHGTIKKATNEDELAAVLAHEIAHITLGHGIASVKAATRKQSLGLFASGIGKGAKDYAGTQGGGAEGLAELTANFADCIQDIAGDLLVKGYSRESELEADKRATEYLKNAGYSRPALTAYLAKLGAAGGTGGWRSTHPSPQDRIDELEDSVTGDPATVAAYVPLREKRFKTSMGN